MITARLKGLVVSRGVGIYLKHESACLAALSSLLHTQWARSAIESGFRVDKQAFVSAGGAAPQQDSVLKFSRLYLLLFVQGLRATLASIAQSTAKILR